MHRRRARREHGDAGSATVWVLLTGLVFVLVAVAITAVGQAIQARQRAQVAADLAALGAALRAWDGEPAACARADELSELNGAHLVGCRLDGLDVIVTVEVLGPGLAGLGTARASARAGPVE
ncbi:MAG TPA: Rv3654c family TadE-like protein [Micromonosporaceae bacterium]|jgi:secretion/DNA translocation related TadE-like protein